MTIFGNFQLGRIGYVIAVLAMFAFDFAKGPIEHAIMKMHDQAANALMEPRPVTRTDQQETGKISGMQMPLMLKGQEDAIREIVNSKGKMSKAEMEAKFRDATAKSLLTFQTNHPADPEIRRLDAQRSNMNTLYFIAVIAMTGITVVGLLWMVSGRLRDIGWPQYYLWLLLAPVFLPKFVRVPLPEVAVHGISLFFYTAIFALAFIPGEDDRNAAPPRGTAPQPVIVKRRSGQFGRLGTG